MKRIYLSLVVCVLLLNTYAQQYRLKQVIAQADFPLTNATFTNNLSVYGNSLAVTSDQDRTVLIYEYIDDNWQFVQYINSTDTLPTPNNFGISLAMFGDDLAISDNYVDDNVGAVYFYKKQIDGSWEETSRVRAPYPPSASSSPYWGVDLYMSDKYVVAGRNNGINRQFHVMTQNEDQSWQLTDTIPTPDDITWRFLATENEVVAIGHSRFGKPEVYIYKQDNEGQWMDPDIVAIPFPDASGSGLLGFDVDTHGDYMLVGSARENVVVGEDTLERAGAVYLLQKEQGVWVYKQRVQSSRPTAQANFGASVSIFNEEFVVGGLDAADPSVHVFAKQNEQWELIQHIEHPALEGVVTSNFGANVELTAEQLVVSSVFGIYAYSRIEDDCHGETNGDAFIDPCYHCVEGNTGNDFSPNTNNCPVITSVSNKVPAKDLQLYPNPASEFIEVIGENGAELRVLDVLGKEVFKTNMESGGAKINVAGWSKGTYTVIITNGDYTYSELIAVE